jgi:Lar family restriction alleviation protein
LNAGGAGVRDTGCVAVSDMTDTEIKPCPFCGDNDPSIDEVDSGVHAVVCNDCGCVGPITPYVEAHQTAEEAIERWNRRLT